MPHLIRTAAHGLARRVLPLALGVACLVLLAQQARGLDWQAVKLCILGIPVHHWGFALLATAGSFWALAQYDLVAHRHFGTGIRQHPARRAGAAAIGLGQIIGFGPAVGAAVRWRLLPHLGHGTILRLTAFVTLSFLVAWGVLVAGLAIPVLTGWPWLALLAGPLLVAGLTWTLWRFPAVRVGRHTVRLPSIPAALSLLGLCLLDLMCAAMALWVLIPADLAPQIPVMMAVYAIALGAGLVGGTPGGAGPFEVTLLTLLPSVTAEPAAAAILGYRIVYYAVPAACAALYTCCAKPAQPQTAPLPRATAFAGPRTELGIAAQSDARFLTAQASVACVIPTPQTLTLFLGAQSGPITPLLPALKDAARQANRTPFAYKISARDAIAFRAAGWCVARQGAEAVINPQHYITDSPAHRQLRRAVRKARDAGVVVERAQAPDWLALAEINADWAGAHGGERGVTMGRFCPTYLEDKPLYIARQDGRVIAFVSLLTGPGQRSLDLMRHKDAVPQGTMHALVHGAISAARREGCDQFSLAGLPEPRLARFHDGYSGLVRFKRCFAPRYRPVYVAAPSRASLILAVCDLWRAVHNPPALERHPTPWPQPDTVAPAQDAVALRPTG